MGLENCKTWYLSLSLGYCVKAIKLLSATPLMVFCYTPHGIKSRQNLYNTLLQCQHLMLMTRRTNALITISCRKWLNVSIFVTWMCLKLTDARLSNPTPLTVFSISPPCNSCPLIYTLKKKKFEDKSHTNKAIGGLNQFGINKMGTRPKTVLEKSQFDVD